MLRLVTAERLRDLSDAQERARRGLPLALYGRRESNDFYLAAIYYFAQDFEAPFWVIARNDQSDFVGSFCGLEAARTAATTFIRSSEEIDWILQGSPLGWIIDVAATLAEPEVRASTREAWAPVIAGMPEAYWDDGENNTRWLMI